uniref:Uncharacterized protein n=1 Tax=Triticum urartu TaxID=4572 RepID=A0A8R7U2G2_TRIUA
MPIQIAASSGRRSHVEILFPFTSPIRAVANWSVEGIIGHEKSRCSISKEESCNKIDDKVAMLKSQGKEAVKRKDYLGASKLYTKVRACILTLIPFLLGCICVNLAHMAHVNQYMYCTD